MRHFSMIAFLFLGSALAGCYDMHGYTPPMPMPDSGPVIGGDAGWVMPAPDAGTPESDSGVVMADAGSDAFVPSMDDAGSDAGLPPGEPIVELLTLPTSGLVLGENEFVRFTIRSTAAPIGVLRSEISFEVHPYDMDAPDRSGWNWESRFHWNTDDIRVTRDGVTIPPDEIRVAEWAFSMTPWPRSISLIFPNEEEIDTAGHEYVVYLTIEGELRPGDSIVGGLNTLGEPDGSPAHGMVTPLDSNWGLYHYTGPHVFTGASPCDTLMLAYSLEVQRSSLVWSPRTAPGHNHADCA
ncbi:MAG TPA: hypothetical protein VMU11_01625, partial [Verrucomicrobiae bacterium]|nr:hypothetical protein [Verrucomicrobiae bacterium]